MNPSALVQQVDAAEHVIVLQTRAPGRTAFLLVGAGRRGSGAGLITKEARQAKWAARLPPGAARQRAREDALVGARVLALREREVVVDQHGDVRVIRAERGRVVVTDDARTDAVDVPFLSLTGDALAAFERRGDELLELLADDAIETRRGELLKAAKAARTKLERRKSAVEADLGRIADADRLAAQAQWFLAEAKRAPRGATKLVVTDWSTGEAVPIELALDPAKTPLDQVEAMFKRAKRLRLGAKIARDRLTQATALLEAVAEGVRAFEAAPSIADLAEAAEVLKRAVPRDFALPGGVSAGPGSSGARATEGRRVPYRTFRARSGRVVLVGKGGADNDALTLHVARPHDLWLHAKDRAGAHVIVQLDKGRTCTPEDLVDAAHLAAHFSSARDEGTVDVQYTHRRYLRKPKGSPPGLVVVPRETVLVLRVEPKRLAELLEREELAGA